MLRLSRLSLLLLASTTLVIAPFVHASNGACDSRGTPALGVVEVSPLGDPSTTFYVDDRGALGGGSFHVYQECNGIEHLQRGGGASPLIPNDNETCVDGSLPPDCMIL